MDSNNDNRPDLTQLSSLSSKSAEAKQSTKKSAFAAFLDSTSTDSTNKRLTYMYVTSKNASSIADEFVLYKSVANKEVEKVVREELNPDASAFWWVWCGIIKSKSQSDYSNDFRRNYDDQLPQLKNLAKRFLSTPATSVPSESAFSVASNLVCNLHDCWYFIPK